MTAKRLSRALIIGALAFTAGSRSEQGGPNIILVASPGMGGCTLGNAIRAANADVSIGDCPAGSGADVILVPAGTYTLTTVDNTTNGLLTGLPVVTSSLTIRGAGPASTIIERAAGSAEFRVLRVWHTGANLSLEGVTVRGGHGSTDGGGGVYANGPLFVHDVVFRDNEAGTHGGGAIRWGPAPLTISSSHFVNNRSSGFEGGALFGFGDTTAPLTISNSTFDGNYAIRGGAITYSGAGAAGAAGVISDSAFTNNTALRAGGAMQINGVTLDRVTVTGNHVTAAGDGGAGLFVDGVTILDSTISNNAVSGPAGGGGIVAGGSALSRRVTIARTTIAGNTADTGGGAALSGLSTIANVTFSGNRSSGNGGALLFGGGQADLQNVTVYDNESIAGRAGGIASESFAVVRLRNSIVSGNRDLFGSPDCHSNGHALQSTGHNLIGIIGACNYTPGSGDLVGTLFAPIPAGLGPLNDNGGSTWTHEPALSSRAVDAGGPVAPGVDPASCEPVDQRGEVRPQRAACDIGAVERKNRHPDVTAPATTTLEDTPVDISVTVADEDGDAVAVEVTLAPTHGLLSGAFPTYTYSPALNYNGPDAFTVLARDAMGGTRSMVVKVAVTPVNDEPSAADDGIDLPANATTRAVPVLANDSTPDAGETLTVISVTAAAHGTTAVAAGGTQVEYTPAAGYSGVDTFTYTISDGTGLSATARVVVAVVPSADLSIAVVASASVLAGGPLTYTATAANGGVIAAPAAAISLEFPSPLAIVSQPAGCVVSGRFITCPIGTLAVGATGSVSVTVEAPASSSITTTASVGAQETDPRLNDNTASVTTTIAPAADLVLSVIDDPDPVSVGGSLAYRVLVRNRVGVTATNVTIRATFPTPGGGSETSNHGVGTLAVGAEVTTLIVRVPQASGVPIAQFSVTASEPDPQPLNNHETEDTIVGTAVAVVNSTGHAGDLNPADGVCDTGAGSHGPECTLRAAIETANGTPGTIIAFRISGGERGFADGVFTIQPGDNLPAITADGTMVEATTQTAFTGDTNPLGPEIVLRGASNRDDEPTGLRIEASNVIVRGLVLNGFATDAGCTNTSCGRGIYVTNENQSVTGTRIEGSYIGLDPAGSAAVPNGRGIEIGVGAADSLIGGTASGHGNVISGNADAGIYLGAVSDRTTIHGNFVGTNRTGTLAVPNGAAGGLVIDGANATVVGGASNGAGNVISGNRGFGIAAISLLRPAGQAPIQTSISGNLIGTDVTGTLALGNDGGVLLSGDGQWLAGTMPAIHNVISGNRASGVVVSGEGRSFILGNYIGTDATGLLPLPNGGATATDAGIKVISGTSSIGGYGFGDANVIAFNNGDGVLIEQPSSLPSLAAVRGNSIHGNARLGIDVGANGVSPANTPGVTAVGNVGAATIVTGTFLALPNQTIGVELFGNTSCDPTGYGEGATPLHALTATADASGHVRFRTVLNDALDPTTSVTAVATDPSGQSSEFSACAAVGAGVSDLSVELAPSRNPAWVNHDVTWQLKVQNSGAANSNIRVSAIFPTGLTYSSLSTPCTRDADVVTCTAPALASGATAVFDLVVRADNAGPMTVTALATGWEPDPNTSNDTITVTLPVVSIVELDVSEQIAVIDQVTAVGSILLTVPETILVIDEPVVVPSLMLTLTEPIGVIDVDNVVPRQPALIHITENIRVTDSARSLPAALIAITETIHAQDSPGLVADPLNTPAGTGVTTSPLDAVTGSAPVTVTFSTVTKGGNTTLVISPVGPEPPAGYLAATPATYFDVSTTAAFSGPATVCVKYDGLEFPPSAELRLFHHEAGAWADQTVAKDPSSSTVCATVTSLSPFAIFMAPVSIGVEGRMAGEGQLIDDAGRDHRFHFRIVERSIGDERGKLVYSVASSKPRHEKARTDVFESTAVGPIAFLDDPSFSPSRAGRPAAHSVSFAGSGRWNGSAGYTFDVLATDAGEPGRGRDRFSITIRDRAGAIAATATGALASGNIQSQRLPGRASRDRN